KDLPPKSTAHHYFMLWDWDGTLERIHHALYVAVREQACREASPSVAIIDSQSGKAAQKGGLRSTRRAMMLARRSRVFNSRPRVSTRMWRLRTIVTVTAQRGILFTYWASPKGDKQHDAAIGAMVQSM